MAGSRIEKFGTIYSRVQGLLKSGALKEVDRPLWLSVYEAFPPKQEPLYERRRPPQHVRKILYPEDFIRVKFYEVFGNPDVVDLTNEKVKTTCQKFVEKFMELQQEGVEPDKVFDETTQALKIQGIRLRTVEEVKQIQTEAAVSAMKNASQTGPLLSVADVFGEDTAGTSDQQEEQDFIMEESEDFTDKPS